MLTSTYTLNATTPEPFELILGAGTTHVSAIDAERMLAIVGNDALTPIAADVRERLAAVVERAVA